MAVNKTFSDYLERALLDHVLGRTTYTPPASVWVGLSLDDVQDDGTTGVSEPSGGSYARVELVNTIATWSNAAGTPSIKQNLNAINFPTPTADWGAVKSFFLADAASGGNILMQCSLDTTLSITTGVIPVFRKKNLTVELQ